MRSLVLSISLMLVSGVARADGLPVTAKGLAQLKHDVYISLAKADYLRSGTCFQVANSALKNMGLEELETPLSSASKRVKTLNGIKVLNLPKFTSRGPLKESADYVGELSAAGDQQNVWRLHVKRFKKDSDVAELETEFVFEAHADDRGALCDLKQTRFISKGTGTAASRTTTTDCLDAFAINIPDDLKKPQASPSRYWLKRDCAFGVHYSAEAKRVVRAAMEANNGHL